MSDPRLVYRVLEMMGDEGCVVVDRIEELEAEVERLREAVSEALSDLCVEPEGSFYFDQGNWDALETLRQALKGGSDE